LAGSMSIPDSCQMLVKTMSYLVLRWAKASTGSFVTLNVDM
jgi:hypothetical protein